MINNVHFQTSVFRRRIMCIDMIKFGQNVATANENSHVSRFILRRRIIDIRHQHNPSTDYIHRHHKISEIIQRRIILRRRIIDIRHQHNRSTDYVHWHHKISGIIRRRIILQRRIMYIVINIIRRRSIYIGIIK
jgi:hypothetical protein